MSELKIRVVAVADRSLGVAYRPLIDAAERARRQLGNMGQATTRQATRDADAHVRAFEKAERDKVKAAERTATSQARIRERSATMAGQYAAREAAAVARAHERATRDRMRENERILRDVERTEAAATRATERGAAARARAEERSLKAARRASLEQDSRHAGVAVGAAKGTARAMVGIAAEIARGAGVQLDLGSHVKSGVELEKSAVDLSNAGYMPGKSGAAGVRQDPRAIEAEIRKVAMSTATDSNEAMAGLQAFVAKTGDLQTGRAMLADMAKLAKASGSDLSNMSDAAGDVANALGDVPDKAGAVREVMQAIAAQGKEGAVEIKDLASQMAKLGAASGQFSGSRTEVIAQMGALTQMTRAKGGAASATQAATALGTFTAGFSKHARNAAFEKYGVSLDSADGKLRNPMEVVIDALRATKGDRMKMGEMFADVNARRVTRGWETVYNEAGGGEAGIKAVRDAFDRLSKSVMTNEEVEKSFAAAMSTTDAQAKVFNEQLAVSANELRAGFAPALKALAPMIVSATNRFTEWFMKPKTDSENDTKNVNAELGAQRARLDLQGDLSKGELSAEHKEGAKTAQAALAAAIKRRKDEAKKDGGHIANTKSEFLGSAPKRLDEMSNDELIAATRVNPDDDTVARFARGKQQTERMEQNLAELEALTERAMLKALSGTLKVEVTNPDVFLGRPPLDFSGEGRTPPPGASKPRGPGR